MGSGRKRVVPWGPELRARTSGKFKPKTAKVAGRRKINKDETRSVKPVSTKQGKEQDVLSFLPVVMLSENKDSSQEPRRGPV